LFFFETKENQATRQGSKKVGKFPRPLAEHILNRSNYT